MSETAQCREKKMPIIFIVWHEYKRNNNYRYNATYVGTYWTHSSLGLWIFNSYLSFQFSLDTWCVHCALFFFFFLNRPSIRANACQRIASYHSARLMSNSWTSTRYTDSADNNDDQSNDRRLFIYVWFLLLFFFSFDLSAISHNKFVSDWLASNCLSWKLLQERQQNEKKTAAAEIRHFLRSNHELVFLWAQLHNTFSKKSIRFIKNFIINRYLISNYTY